MMKFFKFLVVGIIFGIVLVKSEAVSWYRIYEMFKFESFHMYGIIGTAVSTGIILLLLSKNFKNVNGGLMTVPKKDKGFTRYILGGIIFGLGWALSGACPGPMYILIGTGAFSVIILIIAALLGTYIYGIFKDKLPH